MSFRALGMLSALAVSAGITAQTSATVLTFDYGGTNSTQILDTYGDRVGDPNTFQPPAFMYGSAGGITPNVVVDYKPVLRLGAGTNPSDPTRVFGDLTNVLYRDRNAPGFSPGILEINLFADAGFLVCLHSFDLAAVYNSITGFGEDLPAKSIIITDGAGTELFRLNYDINNPPSTVIPGTLPLRSRRFDWDANPLRAQQLRIRIDLTQLITPGGSKADRVGIDNIKFSQIPTPGASAMVLIGGALLGTRRRR